MGDDMSMSLPSIVEAAVDTPELSTLVTVLTMPGYAEVLAALQTEGPLTVFAPTNAAFEKLGATLDTLTTDQIKSALFHHVLVGAVGSMDLQAEQKVATVLGQSIDILQEDGFVKIITGDGATSNVVYPDVL